MSQDQGRCSLINSNHASKKRPPLLKTPSSLYSRPKKSTFQGLSHQKHAPVHNNKHGRSTKIEASTDNLVHCYDNQSFDESNSASTSETLHGSATKYGYSCQSTNCKKVSMDSPTATFKHSDESLVVHQGSSDRNQTSAQLASDLNHSGTSTKDMSDDAVSKSSSKKVEVEYVVLTPKSKKSTGKRKLRPVYDDNSNFFPQNSSDMLIKHSNLDVPQQTFQLRNQGHLTYPPDLPYASHPVQTSGDISQPNFYIQNYPNHQEPITPEQCGIGSTPRPYTGQHISDSGPIPHANHDFVNPYRCLVTPQFPILNAPTVTDHSFYAKDNINTNRTENMSVPPGDAENEVTNNQVNFERTPSCNEDLLRSENKSASTAEKEDYLNRVEIQSKRMRKERPSTPRTHMKVDHLFSLIESIHDVEQIKAASSIVREIIRVLPQKRNASISWVDKETILHAVDELGRHFEDHIKLQIRRSVLRYGFQVINPNFVPDVTNTKCDIGDHEFSNKYKVSKGFVEQETSRDSDSGSDLEQARRLVDSKYYSCWISREYCKHICMQRLSIKTKGEKGEPVSFRGFKWGHPLLKADLDTSFIVRPEHRVPFYQWLNKSTPSKPPKRKYETKPGQPDYLIMKVNLTKPKSGLKGLPQNLCECEFWEFNGTNRPCSVSYQYPKGMKKISTLLAENHPLQPVSFDKSKLQQMIFDCD